MSMGTLEAFFFSPVMNHSRLYRALDILKNNWVIWILSAEGCSSRDSIEWISQFNKYSVNERDFLENPRNLPDTRMKSWKVEMNIFSGYRITYSRSYFLTFIENDKNSHQLSASHHEWFETYVLTVSNAETRAVTKSRVKMRMKNSFEFLFLFKQHFGDFAGWVEKNKLGIFSVFSIFSPL